VFEAELSEEQAQVYQASSEQSDGRPIRASDWRRGSRWKI